MPRVIQVNSSSNLNANPRGEEEAGFDLNENSEENGLNQNDNQQAKADDETFSNYLPFSVNYALYNVTYSPSEDTPYCLKCEIGGRVVRFKKDARVWLHKSSDRKRKLEVQNLRTEATAKHIKGSANLNTVDDESIEDMKQRLGKIQQYFQSYCATYNGYRNNAADVDSDLSSLGDSDADLAYSEASSPTDSQLALNKGKNAEESKRVKFTIADEEIIVTASLDNDDAGKDDGYNNEIAMDMDDVRFDADNASGNNIRSGITSREVVRRLAPAIAMEDESLIDGLLDGAANNYPSERAVKKYRRRRARRNPSTSSHVSGSKTRSRRQAERDKHAFYNLRSGKARRYTENFRALTRKSQRHSQNRTLKNINRNANTQTAGVIRILESRDEAVQVTLHEQPCHDDRVPSLVSIARIAMLKPSTRYWNIKLS
ncbi:uncharacterized protein LOC127868072 [Dreissena polymorpha]|uniref:Uncharacterized protein n=1 Tax=Dreissena polymorpha TaxID=45954 RepID=A0A9D4RJ75_DREPO|nr:uncharacterized protein LOC127868072 [Dreissena polymorpha]KAH3869578.1 hypothetical protein DPMN_032747 [Dreissena polymorpha]